MDNFSHAWLDFKLLILLLSGINYYSSLHSRRVVGVMSRLWDGCVDSHVILLWKGSKLIFHYRKSNIAYQGLLDQYETLGRRLLDETIKMIIN